MRVNQIDSDSTVLTELGRRIALQRIMFGLTQQEASEKAGIALRSWIKMEQGADVKLSTIIRMCRALQIMDNLNVLLIDATPSELEYLVGPSGKKRRVKRSKATKCTKTR